MRFLVRRDFKNDYEHHRHQLIEELMSLQLLFYVASHTLLPISHKAHFDLTRCIAMYRDELCLDACFDRGMCHALLFS